MKLQEFRDLLLTVTDRVSHGEHFKDNGNYIVWQEVSKLKLSADNASAESGYRVAVDYFTKDEYDPLLDKINDVLDCDSIAAAEPEIDFEPETGYTHYAWTCEVV